MDCTGLYNHLKKLVQYSPSHALCFIADQISTVERDGVVFVDTPEPELVVYVSAARSALFLAADSSLLFYCGSSVRQCPQGRWIDTDPVQSMEVAAREYRDTFTEKEAGLMLSVYSESLNRLESVALFGANRGVFNG